MPMRHILRVLLVLCVMAHVCEAKVVTGKVKLTAETCESYVAKFAFSHNGEGVIRGHFSPSKKHNYFEDGAHNLKVHLFNDDGWDNYQRMLSEGSLCGERVGTAAYTTGEVYPTHLSFEHVVSKSELLDRSYYWYVLIADCALEFYDAKPPKLKFHIEFLNGGSHLPADEGGITPFLALVWLQMLGFGAWQAFQVIQLGNKKGQFHLVIFVLGFAYFCQHQAIGLELVHMLVYSYNGKGLRWRYSWLPFDFIADVSQSLSEFTTSFLLIALALGWTLVESVKLGSMASVLGSIRRPIELLTKPTPSSVLVLVLVLAQLVLESWGRQYKDDFNQFHDYEHLPGKLVLMLRLVMWSFFWYGTTVSLASTSCEERVRSFVGKLRGLGSLYFLAFPALVVVAGFLSPLHRHPTVQCGSLMIQSQTLMLIGWQIMRPDSEYSKISSLSQLGTTFTEAAGGSTGLSFGVGSKKLAVD